MALLIESGGLLTTVQDLGRPGYRDQGVPPGGAMDALRIKLANILVGNAPQDAALEITLTGPTVRFTDDHKIALTGADLSPMLDGKTVEMDRPIFVRAGSRLTFGQLKRGARTYMAVSGGIDVPLVLGSRSTYLPAKFGGFEGRALKAGDVLEVGHRLDSSPSAFNEHSFQQLFQMRLSSEFAPSVHGLYTLRVLPGPEWSHLSEKEQAMLMNAVFRLSPRSSRIGYRLSLRSLEIDTYRRAVQTVSSNTYTLTSSAVDFGTIQLPTLEEPILLMADHQTTGGYPRVLQLIQADFPLAAQLKPNDAVNFVLVTREEAYHVWMKQERALKMVMAGIRLATSVRSATHDA